MRASSARSAETSGRSAKPRWTPPIPPVPMKRIPASRAAASVPPTVVAPSAPCATQAARSRGPALRASGAGLAEALELLRREPDDDRAVEHADRCGHGSFGPDRGLRASSPTSTPTPGGKPCATSVVSSATTGPPSWRACCTSGAIRSNSVTGTAPSCPTQRAAASRPELDPADQEPGRERVAGAGRVDDLRAERRVLLDAARRPHLDSARAALDDRRLRQRVGAADHLPLGLVREDDVGASRVQVRAEALRPVARGSRSTTRGRR